MTLHCIILSYSSNRLCRYILHCQSGPFINHITAHRNIATSCILYLPTSLAIVNQTISQEAKQLRVLKGYHGLHQYVHNYWMQHLLIFLDSKQILQEDLCMALQKLCVFKRLTQNGEKSTGLQYEGNRHSIAAQLVPLKGMPEVQELLFDSLVFKAILSQDEHAQKYPEGQSQKQIRIVQC